MSKKIINKTRKQKDTKVSIIIPFFDTSQKLFDQCLFSIDNQTYKNIEVIMVDDGSKNKECLVVANEFSRKKGFRLVHQEKSGVSAARNNGLKHACGDYILFIDSDDVIKPKYVEKMLQIQEKYNSKIIFSGKENSDTGVIDIKIKDKKLKYPQDGETMALNLQALSSQGVLLDASVAKKYTFNTKLKMCEDITYMLDVIEDVGEAYFWGKGGYIYIQHADSTCHKYSIEKTKLAFKSRNLVLQKLCNHSCVSKRAIWFNKVMNLSKTSSALMKCKIGPREYSYLMKEFYKILNLRGFDLIALIKYRGRVSFGQLASIILLSFKNYKCIYFLKSIRGNNI